MDTSRWSTLLLLVALLPAGTRCQTEPTTRGGIGSDVSSPAPSAVVEPVTTSTLNPSRDNSFGFTTPSAPLEDYDKLNELDMQDSVQKSPPKSNKDLTERSKATKEDSTSVLSSPAPVFAGTEAPPGEPRQIELPERPVEDKPTSTSSEPLPGEPASTPIGPVQFPLTGPPPASPSYYGGQPGYVSVPEQPSFLFGDAGIKDTSTPTGESGTQNSGPSNGFPSTYERFPGTPLGTANSALNPNFIPQVDTSPGSAAEVGQGSEDNAGHSFTQDVSSHGDSTLPGSDGFHLPTADTQGAPDETLQPQYYGGPSSFGYGLANLPGPPTVPAPATADTAGFSAPFNQVVPSDANNSDKQAEPAYSTLTTPQPELLGVSNTDQYVPERKSSVESIGAITSSPDSVPSSGIRVLALNDSKTGRSMNLEGGSEPVTTTQTSILDEQKSGSPNTATSSNSSDVATASPTSGAQETAKALPTSPPEADETTQLTEVTTDKQSAERIREGEFLTTFPDRYHPTSSDDVTTAAPSETTSSPESATTSLKAATLSGTVETTATGTAERVSELDIHVTTSPTNSVSTSMISDTEITTDMPSPSTLAPVTIPPPKSTPGTDSPTTVEQTTTQHILTEPFTSEPSTSAPPAIVSTTKDLKSSEPTTTGLTHEASTRAEPTTTIPTTINPTTLKSSVLGSSNGVPTGTEPTTSWPATTQPSAPERPDAQQTTTASATEVPTTMKLLTESSTPAQPTTTEKVIVDIAAVTSPTETPITEAPTTEAPTTAAPTIAAPTASTTEAPTTEMPTTEAPMTEAPMTETPMTEAATTEAPNTKMPTTETPTTDAPTTETPTTEALTTEPPTTGAPTTEPSTTQASTTQTRTTQTPTTTGSGADVPTTTVPAVETTATEEPSTLEATTGDGASLPSVVPVSTVSSASTSAPETSTTPKSVSTTPEMSTPQDTSVTTSNVLFRPGPSLVEEEHTTQADTVSEPPVGETTTAGALDLLTTVWHSASRSPKQLTHPFTSSPDQTTEAITTAAVTDVVSDAAFTTVTPLDAVTISESGEQETTSTGDLFTSLFPEVSTRVRAAMTTEATTNTAHVVDLSDNSIETETDATITAKVSCRIESRNLTVPCLLPQELNNTVTVKFSEWDHGRTESFREEVKRRLADYCLRKGIPLGITTIVFVANEHGMDLISFFVMNHTRGSVVPAATLIAFLNETKPTLEDAVNLTITDVYLGLPLMDAKTASTGVASILGGPFKALYVIIAASVAALLILVVIIILMIKCRSLSSNQYSPDVEKLTKDLHMRSEIGDLRPGDEILKEEAQLKDASAFVINGNGTHLTRDGDGWVVPFSQVPTEAKNGVPDAQDTRL
ncbi:mucin-2 isoform X2 [Ixodes scapularis]|uniref:mucin-2 isoform X2 n=1 Tax=Ixodes scapularis TaxID=6945 RepID=UPI001C38F394|nr:mucin-2 isoform X2 [Ixodes scapularis]